MFEIQQQLDAAAQQRVIDLCVHEVAPRLRRQETGYARGRTFAWLKRRPTYTDPPLAEAQPAGKLWEVLQTLVPDAEAAEVWRNGVGSSPGIHPHRDASYAASTAWILNLGATRFRLWVPNDAPPTVSMEQVKINPKFTEWAIDLEGGELICFDCKQLHGSQSSAAQRWGIGMWKFSTAWKERASFVDAPVA